MGIYEADFEFAYHFVSFKGLKIFKQNVSNLGSFMEESSLKITDWQEYEVHNLCYLHFHYSMWFLEIVRLRSDCFYYYSVPFSATMDSLQSVLLFCLCRIGFTLNGDSIVS
jgi:protein associated with RNAse G/E